VVLNEDPVVSEFRISVFVFRTIVVLSVFGFPHNVFFHDNGFVESGFKRLLVINE